MASPSQNGDETWFSVGLASSYPNITESGNITLSDTIATSCEDDNSILMPGCKVFTVPDGAENGNEDMRVTQLSTNPKEQITASLRRGEQVLVFRYQGRIFAVDNVCASFLFFSLSFSLFPFIRCRWPCDHRGWEWIHCLQWMRCFNGIYYSLPRLISKISLPWVSQSHSDETYLSISTRGKKVVDVVRMGYWKGIYILTLPTHQ